MMAAKLEEEVCERERSKSLYNSSKSHDKSEDSAHACVPLDWLHTQAVENSEEVEKAYKDIFSHLNLAIHNEDGAVKRLHNLEHAKSLAGKLINR